MGLLKKSTPHTSTTKKIPDTEPRPSAEVGELAVDVFQTDEEIVVVAPIAGVTREELTMEITNDVLTIKGSRSSLSKAASEDYLMKECFWGDFSRSVILPEGVNTAKVVASFKDCILTVRVPKVEKVKTRMVNIK